MLPCSVREIRRVSPHTEMRVNRPSQRDLVRASILAGYESRPTHRRK